MNYLSIKFKPGPKIGPQVCLVYRILPTFSFENEPTYNTLLGRSQINLLMFNYALSPLFISTTHSPQKHPPYWTPSPPGLPSLFAMRTGTRAFWVFWASFRTSFEHYLKSPDMKIGKWPFSTSAGLCSLLVSASGQKGNS